MSEKLTNKVKDMLCKQGVHNWNKSKCCKHCGIYEDVFIKQQTKILAERLKGDY